MPKCEACQVLLDDETADMMSQQFIAFDAEMTGLNPRTDRIVELGAVLFENGVPTKTFSSLVNCGLYIRPSSQNVNHITNESLKTAPREGKAYRSFLEFLGPSAQGKVLLCAHNAKCDFTFLSKALERCGLPGMFYFIDTLSLSRNLLNLQDYKQQTIAEALEIPNQDAHRACNDALVCGQIMCHLLEAYRQQKKSKSRQHVVRKQKIMEYVPFAGQKRIQ